MFAKQNFQHITTGEMNRALFDHFQHIKYRLDVATTHIRRAQSDCTSSHCRWASINISRHPWLAEHQYHNMMLEKTNLRKLTPDSERLKQSEHRAQASVQLPGTILRKNDLRAELEPEIVVQVNEIKNETYRTLTNRMDDFLFNTNTQKRIASCRREIQRHSHAVGSPQALGQNYHKEVVQVPGKRHTKTVTWLCSKAWDCV